MNENNFRELFSALTGNPGHFPWQWELCRRFVDAVFPTSCNLPTGLGKTSVIHIWLLALATAPTKVPRRLVYVVNRRTVVDQSTHEAVRMREMLQEEPSLAHVADVLRNLCTDGTGIPLAISTLRGQFADNREWSADPARPAVIVGTVDMIGSRLLFNGYGCGFKSRPLHAGFLGQDVLLVHDEAHLEPAFQDLLVAIRNEQERCGEFQRFRVMELTATSRGRTEQFGLTEADRRNEVVQARINAPKRIELHPIEDVSHTAERVIELALRHEDANQAVLVFLRKLADVNTVVNGLPKERVKSLTGTMRGYERDRLATADPIFARFLPEKDRCCDAEQDATVYLVCTSAGEVGVNISADQMVCDLTPFDSMAQRFGRVNRFGLGSATIDVVYPTETDPENEFEERLDRTLQLLELLDGDASPAALAELRQRSDLPHAIEEAFNPPPVTPPVSDILFDAWALTSVREPLPDCPDVAGHLHGISAHDPPQTSVAWRDEVDILRGVPLSEWEPTDILAAYPLKPHETLQDRTDRVLKELRSLAKKNPEAGVWLVKHRQPVRRLNLEQLVTDHKDDLNNATVLLPPSIGGLTGGTLQASAKPNLDGQCYDVADEWGVVTNDEGSERFRRRVWDNEDAPEDMRLVRTFELRTESEEEESDEEEPSRYLWRWYARPRVADDDGSQTAHQPVPLDVHLGDAEAAAIRIAEALSLPESICRALALAARYHDRGKARPVWQRSIGNENFASPLAKSGRSRLPGIRTHYRHEFGSLIDVPPRLDSEDLSEETRDLLLHLIATHHGRGRPHFPPDELFDPMTPDQDCREIGHEVTRRYAMLQRKYGRWGLAYLESLLRAADAESSANPTVEES